MSVTGELAHCFEALELQRVERLQMLECPCNHPRIETDLRSDRLNVLLSDPQRFERARESRQRGQLRKELLKSAAGQKNPSSSSVSTLVANLCRSNATDV